MAESQIQFSDLKRLKFFKQDEIARAVASKLIHDSRNRQLNGQDGKRRPDDGSLKAITDKTASNIEDASAIFQVLPDIKIAMDIWVSSILSPKDFPNLKNYVGKTLITTDGTTLLGADDKAGVSEIVTAGAYLLAHPEIEHGKIRVAFGPDEEIGRGADLFDVEEFGCDFAYTMDGGPVGELEYESFNAAQAEITIQGKNVHPGTAKDTMVNALEIARQFQNALPEFEVPEHTSGREGFYHLMYANGVVEEAKLVYIIRDHDRTLFEAKKAYLQLVADRLNASLDSNRISIDMKDQYYNMAEIIEKDFRAVEVAQKAMENLSITPIIEPIRGGTDGSKISFMGLPTPNIFAGGENFHGRYEFVAVESMEKARDVIIEIAQLLAK